MARTTAASGAPNVADMPAAAPQARRILRSAGETRTTWPSSDPMAPAGDDDRALRRRTGRRCRWRWRRRAAWRRGPGGDAALLRQDRLHGLGDPVASDHRRPHGEGGDHHRAQDGDDHEPGAGLQMLEGRRVEPDVAEDGQVGDEGDEVQEHPRGAAGGQPDGAGHRRHERHASWRGRRDHRGKTIVSRYESSSSDRTPRACRTPTSSGCSSSGTASAASCAGARSRPTTPASRRRSTSSCWRCGATGPRRA